MVANTISKWKSGNYKNYLLENNYAYSFEFEITQNQGYFIWIDYNAENTKFRS